MIQVNRVENRIRRLEERCVRELGRREREHCRSGWRTRSMHRAKSYSSSERSSTTRLSGSTPLALDKEGQLVIIANRLDDSGWDVTWKALK